MAEYISSWGLTEKEITDRAASGGVWLCVTVVDFQHLCDQHGHVVRLDLPGQIRTILRTTPHCRSADVLRTPDLADAVILGCFETDGAADSASAILRDSVFRFDHFELPCPPLRLARGPLERLLPR